MQTTNLIKKGFIGIFAVSLTFGLNALVPNDLNDNSSTESERIYKKVEASSLMVSKVSEEDFKKDEDATLRAKSGFREIEFTDLVMVKDADIFKYLHGNFLKTSYFLNEAAAGYISPTAMDLEKCFMIIIQYGSQYDSSSIIDILQLVYEQFPEQFEDALKLVTSEESEQIREMVEQEL